VLTAFVIVVTAVAGTTTAFSPGVRRLILGGGTPLAQPAIATAAPPGARAIPTPGASGPAPGGTLDERAVTAQVLPATVDIEVELAYGQGEAGGTGIVLSPSGLVLTDEHVIFEAVSITAQVARRGRIYRAALVGADPADDVALLQMQGASGLQAAAMGDSRDAAVGDPVAVIGYPTSGQATVRGKITDTGVSAPVDADGDWPGANVSDMLESSARVIPGQSGGPMVDSSGRVLGMLESGGDSGGALATPIEDALTIAAQIASGQATQRIVIGRSAVLGAATQDASGRTPGAEVVTVHSGTPAESLGLHHGDVITKIDDSDITGGLNLALVLVRYHPGDRVRVAWIGLLGLKHQGTVALTAGPAP